MSNRRTVSSALASAIALGLVGLSGCAAPPRRHKEACYGVAKRGQNDCANLAGTHTCAGQSRQDMDPGEWRYVAKGSCKDMGGQTADQVRSAAAPAKY